MSVLLGRAADAGLMLRAAIRESQWRSGMTRPVPLGGRADGGAVVTGCAESQPRGGGAAEGLARSGLVHIGCVGGHFDMVRFAGGGLAGGEVVTRLSQVVRNMLGRRGIR